MAGYVKLHRKMLNWGWYSDGATMRVFLDILLNANYADGEYQGHEIKAGQCVIGRKRLAERLGLSEQTIRTALKHLESTGEITIESTNRFSVATIEKWADYQVCGEPTNQQTNQQLTNNQPTTNQPANQQLTTSKKKKNKEIKKYIFKPPTVEEVMEYCSQRKNSVNADDFVDFYESKGWMVGKNKMKDWKAAVRTWERSSRRNQEPPGKPGHYQPEPPKYKVFTPDPEVEVDQMPDYIREKLGRALT